MDVEDRLDLTETKTGKTPSIGTNARIRYDHVFGCSNQAEGLLKLGLWLMHTQSKLFNLNRDWNINLYITIMKFLQYRNKSLG